MKRLTTVFEEDLKYYFAFTGEMATAIGEDKEQSLRLMNGISYYASQFKQDSIANNAKKIFEKYYGLYSQDGNQAPQRNQNRRK